MLSTTILYRIDVIDNYTCRIVVIENKLLSSIFLYKWVVIDEFSLQKFVIEKFFHRNVVIESNSSQKGGYIQIFDVKKFLSIKCSKKCIIDHLFCKEVIMNKNIVIVSFSIRNDYIGNSYYILTIILKKYVIQLPGKIKNGELLECRNWRYFWNYCKNMNRLHNFLLLIRHKERHLVLLICMVYPWNTFCKK